MTASVEPITRERVADRLPERPRTAHKGAFGRVLVVAGSLEYPGAALLTATGALRAGAGLVRVAASESVAARLPGARPEVTWMVLDEEAPGLIAPGGWRRLTAESAGYDAVVIGPGLGAQPATQRRIRNFISAVRPPTVVDADGLNALAGGGRWWPSVRASLVLTPHPGEFSRLTDVAPADAADDAGRTSSAAAAAETWQQVVVLKGARTVVAGPDGSVLRSEVATSALATAGSGDVLSGAIGAFLAGGSTPLDAATCAVAVHAEAGLLAEARIGRAGTLAGEIAALLPEAIARLRGDRP